MGIQGISFMTLGRVGRGRDALKIYTIDSLSYPEGFC